MAEIVNLRRQRKRRERDAAAALAAENRIRHGRTAAERAADAELRRKADDTLDRHRLEEAP